MPAAAQARTSSERTAAVAKSQVPKARPPLVVVRAVGPVPSETLRFACRSLLQTYPVRCEIRASRSILKLMPAWDAKREQIDAREALDILFEQRSESALVELDITTLDIYEQRKPYVFGLASLTDRVAIVSLARLADEPDKLHRRMQKLVLHEAAHTLGLHHHESDQCVMRQDPTPESLDTAPNRLCHKCHAALVRQTKTLARPGQSTLDRVRGHLVRAQRQPAREALVRMLWNGKYDVELLRDFGKVFLEAGQANEAISVYRYALQLEEDPQSRVQLGIAFQMRGREGDHARAIQQFERALEMRPEWDIVAQHLDGLQRRSPSAQGPR